MPLTFGSLFAGIGGFDLGLERAGMVCKWQVEIDPYARRVLEKHWPDVRRYKDVTKFCRRIYDCDPEDEEGNVWCPRFRTEFGECECVGTDELLDEYGSVDVICGGFPCQDISVAGKGAGIDGERSGLWSEFNRIIREIRPKYVIVENVPALTFRGLGRVLGDLAESGFDAEWDCIPASFLGAKHRRNRIWIVAYPQHSGISIGWGAATSIANGGFGGGVHRDEPQGRSEQETANVADSSGERRRKAGRVRRNQSEKRPSGRSEVVPDALGVGLQGFGAKGEQVTEASGGQGIPDWRSCYGEIWATEPAVDRVANGIPKRVDRLRCLGNSVVPQVAEFIGRLIVESVGESR